MGIRDLLKKKNQLGVEGDNDARYSETVNKLSGPEFTFVRSDTNTHEIIFPPSHPADNDAHNKNKNRNSRPNYSRHLSANDAASPPKSRRSIDFFHRSRKDSGASVTTPPPAASAAAAASAADAQQQKKSSHRLSQRLGLRHREPQTSEFVPEDLPQINVVETTPLEKGKNNNGNGNSAKAQRLTDEQKETKEAAERQWEKRATILASASGNRDRSRSISDSRPNSAAGGDGGDDGASGDDQFRNRRRIDVKAVDADIQEAIRLHEAGDLEASTKIFKRLADPYGANDPLSQVLFGLASRHGWGCEVDLERAVTYLSAAASNAATVETKALQAGSKKGGAAKGELVLSIFELANCFRHGWGTPVDPVAAKQYYETAANLGDTDAMNEAAWCYLEGFGCKKDKFQAARYYRLAEKNGNKTIGNTWIWKEKYDPK